MTLECTTRQRLKRGKELLLRTPMGRFGKASELAGAAIFLVQLDHSLKMLGVPTSYQLVIQGAAIAFGMWLSEAGRNIGRRY